MYDNGGNAVYPRVKSLFEDSRGDLWVGTFFQGMFRYRAEDGSFRQWQQTEPGLGGLNDARVLTFLEDNQQKLWIGTSKGLMQLDLTTGALTDFTEQLATKGSVSALLIDEQDTLWVGTRNGLNRHDPATGRFIAVDIDLDSTATIYALLQAPNDRLYVGTSKGLFYYEPSQDKLLVSHQQLTGKRVYGLDWYGPSRDLWVATINDGVFRLSEQGVVSQFVHDKGSVHALGDNMVVDILIDHSGTLWLGTFNAGVDWLDLQTLQFEFFDDSSTSLACLDSVAVYAINNPQPGITWIATQYGLARVDWHNDTCRVFKPDNLPGMGSPEILSMALDGEHLWLGSARGVNRIGPDMIEAEIFADNPGGSVWQIRRFDDGTVYVASTTGLHRWDRNRQRFEKLAFVQPPGGRYSLYQIVKDNAGRIWVSSDIGLFFINGQDQLQRVETMGGYSMAGHVRSLVLDNAGQLWIGIEDVGLFVVKPDASLIKAITDIEQLKGIQSFSAMLQDSRGHVWVSSNQGIERIDPVTWQIQQFTHMDGLQGKEFTLLSADIDHQGKLYFGGRKGLTRFDPLSIETNAIQPKMHLTGFLYFNERLTRGGSFKGFTLDQPLTGLDELTLTYKDYVFGFEFAGLHYANPDNNRYAYKMENYDEDWQYTDARYRRATYSNLDPGDYVFKLRGSNNHGLWSEQARTVNIKVLPPPWATPWAYTLYVILSIAALVGFIRYRTAALEKRSKVLEQSVKARTEELADEKNKVEQLLSRKNEEFANVSHEFRTPLTLILGPLGQVLKTGPAEPTNGRLQVVRRNAFRLLRMVDQLLNMETFRVKAITQKAPQAVGRINQTIAEAFKDLAEEKGIAMTLGQVDEVNFEFTVDAMEKIVLNLVSNAIKYTKSGGTIHFEALRQPDDTFKITVRDTGIGIPPDKLDSVFDRFNRVLDENSEQVTGAGIGLALVKSLVDAHQGQITIDSELG